jgi:hypothetical protein
MSQGQTAVLQESPVPFAGQIDNSSTPPKLRSMLNKTGGSQNAGLAVKFNLGGSATIPGGSGGQSNIDEAANLAASADNFAGVIALDMQTDPDNIAGSYNYHEGVEMPVVESGDIWVLQDQALATVNDPVYVRYAAGTGTVNVPGAFGNAADGVTNRVCNGAQWKNIGSGVAGTPALLHVDAFIDAATR